MSGMFITFEGPEGAGKTTLITLVKDMLVLNNISCTVIREPGGTKIGEHIRNILLDDHLTEMIPRTEILLYAASRAQLVEQVIRPLLNNEEIVLCDRYVDSSIAYQGYGMGWNLNEVRRINQFATGGLQPDRTYLLDVTIDVGQKRLDFRGIKQDRIEQKEKMFHQRVRSGYLQMSEDEPDRYRVVNTSQNNIDKVLQEIINDLFLFFKEREVKLLRNN